MNIQITHSWLLEHLNTKAAPQTIANYLSLCGPSVEDIKKIDKDWIYDIEITTNRVDTASVRGIAREAAAILPQFNTKAALKPLKLKSRKKVKKLPDFSINLDSKFTHRVMGIVIEDIENFQTPEWMKKRLEAAGIRSLGAPIDITNYVMIELGYPTHVFDFDLICNKGFIIRKSKKGEVLTSLENKKYTLPGGDIVITNKNGEIIDLPGIIGTKNSIVNKNTKRILFFLENIDPVQIRKTSMSLGIRTMAVALNEKSVDPYLGETALLKGIELFEKVCKAKAKGPIIDIFPGKPAVKTVTLPHDLIENKLGISLQKKKISKILTSLEFSVVWSKKMLSVTPPTFRTKDISIPEDVIEEVARIYGYHNLPGTMMSGIIPQKPLNTPFAFERKIRSTLAKLKSTEVYTLSLVGADKTSPNSLKIKNPLGKDTAYLRTSLIPSLIEVAKHNTPKEKFHIYEMSNVYLPRKKNLPEETVHLSGVFKGYSFQKAKGVLEKLFEELATTYQITPKDNPVFNPGQGLIIKNKKQTIGIMGIKDETNLIVYEINTGILSQNSSKTKSYQKPPQYPAHIEDLTLTVPPKTYIGNLIDFMLQSNKAVVKIKLISTFKSNYTFRIFYQHPNKTLSNTEVEKLRNNLINKVASKFGCSVNA